MKYIINIILITAASLIMVCCSKEADPLVPTKFEEVKPGDLSLSLLGDSITADGITYARFLLKMNRELLSNHRTVTFTISPIGKFSNGNNTTTSTFDENGESIVYVSSVNVGMATVKAEISNLTSLSASVNFVTSFPEQLLVSPAVGTMPSGPVSSTNIVTKLVKASGVVSEGLTVFYYDSTSTGNSVGAFLNVTGSSNTGESTATYAIQDTSYRGFIYLKTYVVTKAGKVRGSAKVLR